MKEDITCYDNRPIMIVLVGPPGSGKTTDAKRMEHSYVRISQDDQGKNYKKILSEAMMARKDVVIDRMNFSAQQRMGFIQPAYQAGYRIELLVYNEPRLICRNRILNRLEKETHPTIKDIETADKALETFFSKYEKPESREGYDSIKYLHEQDSPILRPRALCVDLDGTLCDTSERQKYVRNLNGDDSFKKDWASFFREIPNDKPNLWCLSIVQGLASTYQIVFVSGRGEQYREVTKDWLAQFGLSHHPLYMRCKTDSRDDTIAKENILDFELIPRYNVAFAIDDRQRIVKMWRRRGITCLDCTGDDF